MWAFIAGCIVGCIIGILGTLVAVLWIAVKHFNEDQRQRQHATVNALQHQFVGETNPQRPF